MHSDIFREISLLLALSASIAIIMRALRQPLIIGHILTGIIVGPSLLGLINSPETIQTFGQFGIALLLFIVGLGLNPKVVKEVGRVSLLTGVGQVIFTSLFGFILVKFLGYSTTASIYISIALTFSSTIIILKLLSDKKEQNKLFGKISIGFLLVQDVIAAFALVVASAAGNAGFSFSELAGLAAKGTGFVILIFILSRYAVRPLTNFLARTQELLFLFALSWGLAIATAFFELGFSLEVGALLAGVALSTMTYAQEVSSRLRPLRDFFIVVFFISLGANLQLAGVGAILPQAIVLSIFVLVGNPMIVMVIMGLLGYTRRTSFKAGLAVAQISEFSFIFILLGLSTGQVTAQAVTLVTVIGITTIALSSYMITYSDEIYQFLDKYLRLFERKKVLHEHSPQHTYDAVLFGYKKGGSEFIRVLPKIAKRYVVVDYDPEVIDELERKSIPYLYGDTSDAGLLEEIDLAHVKLVITLISDHQTNVYLLRHIEEVNPKAVVVCHADNTREAAELYMLGASYVMMPTYLGSEKLSSFIKKNGFDKSSFQDYRKKHIAHLQNHYDASLNSLE